MRIMVLLIEEQYHTSFNEVEKHLKTKFISIDHMMGFMEGYLFDNFKILSLFEYETKLKSHSPSLKNKWLKFVTIEE